MDKVVNRDRSLVFAYTKSGETIDKVVNRDRSPYTYIFAYVALKGTVRSPDGIRLPKC